MAVRFFPQSLSRLPLLKDAAIYVYVDNLLVPFYSSSPVITHLPAGQME